MNQQDRRQDQRSQRSHQPALEEDFAFQRRQARVERIAWATMTVLVIAALAGVFGGGGPLASSEVSGADGSSIRYERFVRHLAPTTLSVNLASKDGGGRIRLRVDEKYFETMTIRSIVPTPLTSVLADRQYVFSFERAPNSAVTTIHLQVEANALGRASGWIAVNDGAPVSFGHFIYP
jgi:hypothetical protein